MQGAHQVQTRVRRLVWAGLNSSQSRTAPPRPSMAGEQSSHDDQRVVRCFPNSQKGVVQLASKTYLNLVGNSQPINIQNRALGDISPGRPLNLARCGSASPGLCRSVRHVSTETNCNELSNALLPSQYLFPCLLIQEIVYVHHRLDVLDGCLPALSNQRVVKLLW